MTPAEIAAAQLDLANTFATGGLFTFADAANLLRSGAAALTAQGDTITGLRSAQTQAWITYARPADTEAILDALAAVKMEVSGAIAAELDDIAQGVYALSQDRADANASNTRLTLREGSLRTAIQSVLIAASYLEGYLGSGHPPAAASLESVRTYYQNSGIAVSVWRAWAAILNAQDAL